MGKDLGKFALALFAPCASDETPDLKAVEKVGSTGYMKKF